MTQEVMNDATRVVELQQKLRLLEFRAENAALCSNQKKKYTQDEIDLLKMIDTARIRSKKLKEELDHTNKKYQNLTESLRLDQQKKRIAAVNQSYDFFASSSRVYNDVIITSVDELGVEITHRNGTARVAVENLSGNLVDYFGLNVKRSAELRKEEQNSILAYEKSVEKILQNTKSTEIADSKNVISTPIPQISSTSLPESSPFYYKAPKERTVYRVRNQGRPYYYYVFPLPNCSHSNSPCYYYYRTKP